MEIHASEEVKFKVLLPMVLLKKKRFNAGKTSAIATLLLGESCTVNALNGFSTKS